MTMYLESSRIHYCNHFLVRKDEIVMTDEQNSIERRVLMYNDIHKTAVCNYPSIPAQLNLTLKLMYG